MALTDKVRDIETALGTVSRASQIYRGESRLALAIDIGTLTSAVHIVLLERGYRPRLMPVSVWPGQSATLAHVPSRMHFSADGQMRAGGAEPGRRGWSVARLFKLHLHPLAPTGRLSVTETIEEKRLRVLGIGEFSSRRRTVETSKSPRVLEPPPLPPGVSLKHVYACWLHYLVRHARTYFSSINTAERWSDLFHDMTVLLVTPNSWEYAHQAFLRDALYRSGVLQNDAAPERCIFVPEAEASLHHVLARTHLRDTTARSNLITVCDAGAAFTDVTTYVCVQASGLPRLREVVTSNSEPAGGLFVSQSANRLFADRLARSHHFSDKAHLGNLQHSFEVDLKRRFSRFADGDQLIPFACEEEEDLRAGIVAGCLSISPDELDSIFVGTTRDVCSAIAAQYRQTCMSVRAVSCILQMQPFREAQSVAVTGGFASSPYLLRRLNMQVDHLVTSRTTESEIKAACEGAALFFLGRHVRARCCRAHYGVNTSQRLDPSDPEHRKRAPTAWPDGQTYVAGKWASLANKGELVEEGAEEFASFVRQYRHPAEIYSTGDFVLPLLRSESLEPPEWCALTSQEPHLPGISTCCTLRADLRSLRRALIRRDDIWELRFRVCLQFGSTSLCARIRWLEQGVECEGDVEFCPT